MTGWIGDVASLGRVGNRDGDVMDGHFLMRDGDYGEWILWWRGLRL
jgi:hypothetical protein